MDGWVGVSKGSGRQVDKWRKIKKEKEIGVDVGIDGSIDRKIERETEREREREVDR